MVQSVEIPKVMKALVALGDGKVAVQDHPVPEVGADDVLVRVVAVAQNPTDHKFIDSGRAKPGTVSGCDFSGTIVQIGPSAAAAHPDLRVGAQVAGFVMGGTFADYGAFAEYVRTPVSLVWPVPEGTFSHEEAATLGCAFWTAVQALYHPTRLALVEPPEKTSEDVWLYVHGGSSAVGQFAIQLGVISGYRVATTASPRNFDLVRSLGASAVFDYRDADAAAKLKDATGDKISAALDTIGTREAQALSTAVIAQGGGKVVHIINIIPDVTDRTDVERIYTLLYWALGRAFSFGPTADHPVRPEDRAHMEHFLTKVPGLVKAGQIKPLPIKFFEGGLAAIPEGFQYMREGNVSAEKIVYRI
ncbi:hypothetical protein VTO73DRAFT_13532 [Trametes versicolor]